MRYFCLVCDYDGTIAHDGRCAPSTVEALKRVRASGRKLILATGRQLPELQEIFPEHSMFDRIIAENGAILYRPEGQDCKALADPPPPVFVEELRRRGVNPLSVGQSIVATWHPHETTVLDVIRDLGLDLHGALYYRPTMPVGQCDARSRLGRRRVAVGLAIRSDPVRSCLSGVEGALRPQAVLPLRWRDDVLTSAAGCAMVEVA